MELDYQAIGVRIRRLRKERGLTQQTLAEMSGQEPSNISHIERGATKLSLPTLVSVANALEVTVDQILCDSLPASRALATLTRVGRLSLVAPRSIWEMLDGSWPDISASVCWVSPCSFRRRRMRTPMA